MHVYPTAQVPKETHIIETAPHLMPSQLDTVAGDLLKRQASNGVDYLCKVFPAAMILYLLLYSFIMTTYSLTYIYTIYCYTIIYIYICILYTILYIYILYIYIYTIYIYTIYILYMLCIYIYIDISMWNTYIKFSNLRWSRSAAWCTWRLRSPRSSRTRPGRLCHWGGSPVGMRKKNGKSHIFFEKNGKIWRCWDEKRVSQIWRC